ncbi:MAG: biopolymer transporter ExbD [Verrucomicrobiales bacterium]
MQLARRKLLIDPPATAAPDIAFILIVFFLVCASVQPDTGRRQDIPRSEETPEKAQQTKNVEVSITKAGAVVNGTSLRTDQLGARIKDLLAGKNEEADRVVIVKSARDVPYQHWVRCAARIEEAGGIITLRLEQEQTVTADAPPSAPDATGDPAPEAP